MTRTITKKTNSYLKWMLLIAFFCFNNFLIAQSKWEVFHEDANIRIEYQISECNDNSNNYNFSFYLIKILNKNSKSLHIQYSLTENTKEEDFFSFTIKAKESVEGKCNSELKYLKKYIEKNDPLKPFNLYKIKVYEL